MKWKNDDDNENGDDNVEDDDFGLRQMRPDGKNWRISVQRRSKLLCTTFTQSNPQIVGFLVLFATCAGHCWFLVKRCLTSCGLANVLQFGVIIP